ncbi:unnamed protein product [Trichobilharzia regenti]|nr:unnamed protein product [Trichobilharzia regenti]
MGKLTSWNHVNVMPRDMQVWVTNVDYYEELGHILQQTSFSELQDYITFAILHKYGGFVDQQIAQLKRKLLKPYAGMSVFNQYTIPLLVIPYHLVNRTCKINPSFDC